MHITLAGHNHLHLSLKKKFTAYAMALLLPRALRHSVSLPPRRADAEIRFTTCSSHKKSMCTSMIVYQSISCRTTRCTATRCSSPPLAGARLRPAPFRPPDVLYLPSPQIQSSSKQNDQFTDWGTKLPPSGLTRNARARHCWSFTPDNAV